MQYPNTFNLDSIRKAYEQQSTPADQSIYMVMTHREGQLMYYSCFMRCENDTYLAITMIVNGVLLQHLPQIQRFFRKCIFKYFFADGVLSRREGTPCMWGDLSIWKDFDSCSHLVDKCGNEFRSFNFSYLPLPPLDPGKPRSPDDCLDLSRDLSETNFAKASAEHTYTASTFLISSPLLDKEYEASPAADNNGKSNGLKPANRIFLVLFFIFSAFAILAILKRV